MIEIDGYQFEGRYAGHFENFVSHKRSLGYKYTMRHIRALVRLNNFLSDYPKHFIPKIRLLQNTCSTIY